MTTIRPTQHPASTSDARKRAADLATPDWGSDLREALDLDAIRARAEAASNELDRMTTAVGDHVAPWRWSIPPNPERDSDLILSASLTDVPDLLAEVERLARWKAEALPVLVGLQELGKALGLPLGERITGQSAAEAAQSLLARADAAEAERDEARVHAEAEAASRVHLANRVILAEAERDAAREALARVEAVADEWERNYASMLVGGFSGCSIGADSAAKRIRAALAQPATDEATAKQGFVVRADEPRCWRSECRNWCGYPGACSEKPATDEGAGA